MEEAFVCKKLCYIDLVAEAAAGGWNAEVHPVEVGCRGLGASFITRFLKYVGISG